VDNPNNVRREASRQFRNKKMEYLKANMMNLKLTVRSKISEISREASTILRRVDRLDLI
jgi:hypothetical protein